MNKNPKFIILYMLSDSNEEVLCSFATEDTPLTFSRADSDLSDISFDDKPETDKRHLINHRSSSEDLSDDLLSAAIEAGLTAITTLF